MNRLFRLAQSVGVNTIPLVGVFWKEWSDSTAIAFYWCETAIAVLFVSLRLMIHQRVTRKRGHYVESRTRRNGGPWKSAVGSYNSGFLLVAIGFGGGNLIFLSVLLLLFSDNIGGGKLDAVALRDGTMVAAAFLALGFAADLPHIAQRPFASVRRLAEAALGRVFVIYIAIFVGMFCAMILGVPHAIFGMFFALKLFTDVASNFGEYDPEQPPWWLSAVIKDPAFRENWTAERIQRLQAAAEDEETFAGVPSRSGPSRKFISTRVATARPGRRLPP
jgi:hypothetical protein